MSFPSLDRNIEVDVAVVGGGITGVTTALLLQRAGKRVALLDAHRVAEGVTGNTTAHLTEALDTRYVTLTRDFGLEGARLAAQASRASVDRIERFVQEHRISCHFQRMPGYLFSEREEDLEELHAEYEAARQAGADVAMTRAVPLAFARAALRFERQASFHVREYLLPLLGELAEGGCLLFEDTTVLEVKEGEPCTVHTEYGDIAASEVVLATHAPLTRFALQTKIAHYRSYALALSVDGPAVEGLFWDTATPYHYLRSAVSTVAPEPVLIIGGEDHKTGSDEATEARYEALLNYARARFDVKGIVARWSAQIIEPVDGLPFIGRGGSEHVHVATGYSGNGMTFGTMAAMIMSDAVLRRMNPWSELFDASRIKPLAAAKAYIRENADVAMHLVGDRLKKGDARDLEDVPPGEGKVVYMDGKRLAVYREPDGSLHTCSAVCPHLGCIVHFNAAETTWDCPCHGSRFGVDGSMINGPATSSLAPYTPTGRMASDVVPKHVDEEERNAKKAAGEA